jgi:hypothetical protein
MSRLFAVLFSFCLITGAEGKDPRNLLTSGLPKSELSKKLIALDAWRPFPMVAEREQWQALPAEIRSACLKEAEEQIGAVWEVLPATSFLEYKREGNRTRYERILFARRARLANLVLAEAFENQGRFLDDIANGVWAVCEESYWGVPAHIGMQKRGVDLPDVTEPTIDLFAAETASLLAWTHYLLGEQLTGVSPLVPERIRLETERRILGPGRDRDDFWWMGFGSRDDLNNWTPWICSNWLSAALLLEKDQARRVDSVYRVMTCLDNFLNVYPDDGGCDEGPGYWGHAGASLFDCLELLGSATGGALNLYDKPLIRNIGQYIYRVYIKDDYFINFADASGRVTPNGALVYRYGNRIDDPVMTGFGSFLVQRAHGGAFSVPRSGSLVRVLPDLFSLQDVLAAPPVEPLLADFYLPDLEVMGARSAGQSDQGFYLAAKGGHNDESHNHNDVGNFIVYADGKPVLIDVGVETYTAKTFSSRRYEIWTMQSGYHNLPTINGVMQRAGLEYRALNPAISVSAERVSFSLDIAPAYPEEARVRTWMRTLTLERGQHVELHEAYVLKDFLQPIGLNLMTPLVVQTVEPGTIKLSETGSSQRTFVIRYDPSLFQPEVEEMPITDARLSPVWGNRLARIQLTAKSRDLKGEYRIRIARE